MHMPRFNTNVLKRTNCCNDCVLADCIRVHYTVSRINVSVFFNFRKSAVPRICKEARKVCQLGTDAETRYQMIRIV